MRIERQIVIPYHDNSNKGRHFRSKKIIIIKILRDFRFSLLSEAQVIFLRYSGGLRLELSSGNLTDHNLQYVHWRSLERRLPIEGVDQYFRTDKVRRRRLIKVRWPALRASNVARMTLA